MPNYVISYQTNFFRIPRVDQFLMVENDWYVNLSDLSSSGPADYDQIRVDVDQIPQQLCIHIL
jgi:hypothetical protein